MGLKQLRLNKVADRFRRVFMDEVKCDLYRSEKVFDEVGGDICVCPDKPIYQDIPCYYSQHPWYTTAIEDHPGYVTNRANYRFHFHPSTDIKEGDIIFAKLEEYAHVPHEQFLVQRCAYYPTHIRVECGVWQPRE